MTETPREFQVFAKPAGARCNLGCTYCYYLGKTDLYPGRGPLRMADEVLERYVVQHIEASAGDDAVFSWHGGEPTLLGLDYFRKIVALQKKHAPRGRRVLNGVQTNGTLIDAEWARFFAEEGFSVGVSLDGPAEWHDSLRVTPDGGPTHGRAVRGYRILEEHGVACEILCVVSAVNVRFPIEVYRSFKRFNAEFVTFLPLVERRPSGPDPVGGATVPAAPFGEFLCAVFDEWKERDIGRVKIQIVEEAVRTALSREHALCVFRKTCGGVPVLEHNGDFYSCDHFVDPGHLVGNIMETPLGELLDSPKQRDFGLAKRDTLPGACRECEVLDFCNGECPRNRFVRTDGGEAGLNYLCAGYKRFFTHCRPFVDQVAAQWRRQEESGPAVSARKGPVQSPVKTGRNAPCPCGSGRKYKDCCLVRDPIPVNGQAPGPSRRRQGGRGIWAAALHGV